MNVTDRRQALDEFYEILTELEIEIGGKRYLSDCNGRMDWPLRGVYFFFEDEEYREDGVTPRVVRVGTHALTPSASTLWGRLSAHKGNSKGTLPGGGNHRGSIFRLHVGTALLARESSFDDARKTWGVGSSANRTIREKEYDLERAVSQEIGAMPFLWLRVDDPPGTTSARGEIERGAISLLSNLSPPIIDRASTKWLGHSADRLTVRDSGLWNVNHASDAPSSSFLPTLRDFVEQIS